MIAWLRWAAAAIALAALVDPAIDMHQPARLPVDVVAGHSAIAGEGTAVLDRVTRQLSSVAALGTGEPASAVILLGTPPRDAHIQEGVPVFAVDSTGVSPNVRIARVTAPGVILPGEQAVIGVDLDGAGMVGKSSTLVLEQSGVTLARVEHRWSADRERFHADLRHTPTATGMSRLSVVARPLAGERTDRDNRADLAVAVAARTLRVLVHEPRPSWGATFVRRALEADPVFEVVSLAAPSRGRAVKAGAPPPRLTARDLEPFDAVVIGAPDALAASDVTALDAFARERGGGVLLVPDRRPSGPWRSLLQANSFDEILLDRPAVLDGDRAVGLHASEFSVPADSGRATVALATVQQGSARRPVVVSWPRGAGRVIFSGALDAWRYRARDEDGFSRFWTAVVAGVAAAAPPRIGVRIDPAIAAPGESVSVRVTVRRTELVREGAATAAPAVEARLIGTDGADRSIRVWPTSEPGVFEGRVAAAASGRYDVRASLGTRAAADGPLLVADDVVRAGEEDREALRWVAASTGGIMVTATEIDRLEAPLRSLARPAPVAAVRPMRSPWWMLPFASALCSAWALGRRRGLR